MVSPIPWYQPNSTVSRHGMRPRGAGLTDGKIREYPASRRLIGHGECTTPVISASGQYQSGIDACRRVAHRPAGQPSRNPCNGDHTKRGRISRRHSGACRTTSRPAGARQHASITRTAPVAVLAVVRCSRRHRESPASNPEPEVATGLKRHFDARLGNVPPRDIARRIDPHPVRNVTGASPRSPGAGMK